MEEIVREGVKKLKEKIEQNYTYKLKMIKEELEKNHQDEVKVLKDEMEKIKVESEDQKKLVRKNTDDVLEKKEKGGKAEINNGVADKEKDGFLKKYTKQIWRYELEYKKKLLRVVKGENYGKAVKKVGEWIL